MDSLAYLLQFNAALRDVALLVDLHYGSSIDPLIVSRACQNVCGDVLESTIDHLLKKLQTLLHLMFGFVVCCFHLSTDLGYWIAHVCFQACQRL